MSIVSVENKKPKTTIFEKGQFSRHFEFGKNNFFLKRKSFYSEKQELCFFEKKLFFFFFKTMFFLGNCFSKTIFSKFSKTFLPIKNLGNFFLNFFEKTNFQKKTFFFQKKKQKCFFFKNWSSCLLGKTFLFSPKKQLFLSKTKCPLNCRFSKMVAFGFVLQIQSTLFFYSNIFCGSPLRPSPRDFPTQSQNQ